MSRRNRNRQSRGAEGQSLEQAYAQHVQQYPNLHDPSIIQGSANEQQLQTDFRAWLGGVIAASRMPHMLSQVNLLQISGGQVTGRLFSFLRGQGVPQSGQQTTPSLTQMVGSRRPSGGGRTIDELTSNIVNEYRSVRAA